MSVGFGVAALAGIAPDGGLYVPESIPELPASVRSSLASMDFRDLAFEVAKPFVSPDIPESALEDMIQDAYPFGAPLVPAGDRFVLELFHGPTAAFKDFGARFMSRAFAYLRRGEDKPLRILVATSGDTGGAVADGFHGVPGIQVTVLYPKGRVSPLQERQIAGLGGNVSAFAVEGSFDDCQALVKAAFADAGLNRRVALSSANSINISRLIPQAFYYVAAAGKAAAGVFDPDGAATPRTAGTRAAAPVGLGSKPVVFCVPSGNFGNLTAGLYAKKMGAPIDRFIAATNANRTVPDYLESGSYRPRSSQATISNAMDVGAPSNFERMAAFWSHAELSAILSGASVGDDLTKDTIVRTYERTGYALDPHTAVGWNALDAVERREERPFGVRVVLATAHPAKFSEVVEPLIGKISVPESLSETMRRSVSAATIPASLEVLAEAL
jgi:threonine synthase